MGEQRERRHPPLPRLQLPAGRIMGVTTSRCGGQPAGEEYSRPAGDCPIRETTSLRRDRAKRKEPVVTILIVAIIAIVVLPGDADLGEDRRHGLERQDDAQSTGHRRPSPTADPSAVRAAQATAAPRRRRVGLRGADRAGQRDPPIGPTGRSLGRVDPANLAGAVAAYRPPSCTPPDRRALTPGHRRHRRGRVPHHRPDRGWSSRCPHRLDDLRIHGHRGFCRS